MARRRKVERSKKALVQGHVVYGFPRFLPQSEMQVTSLIFDQAEEKEIARTPSWSPVTPFLRASNARPNRRKLFFNALVATVDVVHAVDHGFAFCDEPGQNKRRAGAQVRGENVRAGELCGTVDHGAAAVDRDVRAHADHFAGVQEAV